MNNFSYSEFQEKITSLTPFYTYTQRQSSAFAALAIIHTETEMEAARSKSFLMPRKKLGKNFHIKVLIFFLEKNIFLQKTCPIKKS